MRECVRFAGCYCYTDSNLIACFHGILLNKHTQPQSVPTIPVEDTPMNHTVAFMFIKFTVNIRRTYHISGWITRRQSQKRHFHFRIEIQALQLNHFQTTRSKLQLLTSLSHSIAQTHHSWYIISWANFAHMNKLVPVFPYITYWISPDIILIRNHNQCVSFVVFTRHTVSMPSFGSHTAVAVATGISAVAFHWFHAVIHS